MALLLAGVTAVGSLLCLMGYEALATGTNRGAWLEAFFLLVLAPGGGLILCVMRIIRGP